MYVNKFYGLRDLHYIDLEEAHSYCMRIYLEGGMVGFIEL